jgi:hypothetical protein
MTIPPLYKSQHNSALTAASQAASDPSWWVLIGSYDATVMRLWGVASVVLLVWGLASVLWVSVLVRRSRGGGRAPTVVDGVKVAVTDALGPATVGLWRSRVVIPRWVLGLPGTQRQYVLRHEDEHRKAHDTQLLILSSLVLVLTPWNLPLYWQLRRLSLAVEMDCDNRVVSALGNASAYGELLLNIAQATSRGPRLQPSFLGGAGMLERRLTGLLTPAQLPRVLRYVLPALAIGLLYIVLSTPHPVLAPGLDAHHVSSHHAGQR